MSTLSGILSKGEKGKSKFQSLDINNLYRVSRGESLEQHQQKNTLPRKHGMQTLGRVPSARRPPANLPSLKSETSSSDPAVSLVPSGGSGWATTKDSGSSSTNTIVSTTATDSNTTNSSPAQCVTGSTAPTSLHPLLPGQQGTSHSSDANNKSSWSAIMSKSGDAVVGYAGLVGGGRGGRSAPGLSFLAHQSPQFQHEFPSLSGQPSVSASNQSQTQESSATSNAISVAVQHHSLLQQQPYSHNHSGGALNNQQQQQNRELNAQYGPGPSLRPQTEGSWIQGGSRTTSGTTTTTGAPGNGNTPAVQGPPIVGPSGSTGHTEALAGGRQNLGQSPNMAMGQAGQSTSPNSQGPLPSGSHQIYRGNFPSGFPSQFSPNVGSGGPRPRFNYPPDRFPLPQRPQERDRVPEEEIITRPIIKEEDLTRMDDISRDAGWAAHDDIDYNQKLAFSDDEPEPEPPKKEEKKDVKAEEKLDENHSENKDKPRDNRDNRETAKDNRDQPTHRPWNQSTLSRDLRGPNGPNCFSTQSSLQSVHSLRVDAEDDEAWNERRRLKVEVAFVVKRARQRKEEEEKRFQESTKQAAAKKLQDLEKKLQEKQSRQKEDERGPPPEPKGLISVPPVPIPVPEWEREKEIRERENRERERERSRTSSEGKDDKSTRESREPRDNIRESRDTRDQLMNDRQNDRQLDRQNDRQIDRQNDRQLDRQNDRQLDRQNDRQLDRQNDRQLDRQNDRQIDRQNDRQIDRQNDRQIDRQIDRQNDRQIDRQNDRQIDRQNDRQIDRQNDRQIDRQNDRPNDRQNERPNDRPNDRQNDRQIDRQNFLRQPDIAARSERERERDRDQRDIRDREYPGFLRHFQTNIPPRFQKQQAERGGSGFNRISPSAERSSQSVSFAQQYDSGRWGHNHNNLIDNNTKQSHAVPPPRRSRIDSDVSSPLEEDRSSSRDHRGQLSREDRYRHPVHRKSGGYYDEYTRTYKDYDWDDRHPREPWERERHFDDKERETNLDSRDGRESRENRPIRQNRDSVENRDRDNKEKKDYDNYLKDTCDERERCDDRERSDGTEWRDDRTQERQTEKRREIPREERIERNERPQRPDSRDSRTSRESKTSSRDDEPHKLRDCGLWVNEISDYEEKKRDLYHENNRERERDRRQPPGPVTKEKLEADDLKSEKRNLTQLKRNSSEQEKKDTVKETVTETKKETDIRSRKSERITETSNRPVERGDSSPKAWADAVSPTFEKEEEKILETFKDINELENVKQNLEKLTLEKREDVHIEDTNKEHVKEEKREKNTRNRTSSGSSSSRARDCRGGRQWGGSIYTRWSGQESRGRRGGSKSSGRPASARSGSYGHTDSENSADEVSGSTESGKEERRSAKSPKLSQKIDKEERNREVSRREDKRTGEYSQARNEKRSYDGKPSREGFAPSGEPSRRGRGGFRIRSSGNNSNRMEGYGPPSSKSPFSSERNAEEKQNTAKQCSTTTASDKETNNSASTPIESSDDKMIAKQQALTAGITGRRTKSPNPQSQQSNKQDNHQTSGNVVSQKPHKKEESLSKRTRSGSRRGKDTRESRFRGSSSNVSKQTSSDVGNEEWETTSENSEDHMDDHKESRNSRNKHFNGRGNQNSNQNAMGGNLHSRRNEQGGNNRDQREKNSKSSSASSRAPGAEKRNVQNSSFCNQRNQSSISQSQNGRSRSQGSSHGGSMSNKSSSNKENTVNRIDEIKLNEPNLVNQAFNDMNKKSQSKEKKIVDNVSDSNNFTEDGSTIAEDKLDSDGFQEVRSKKNVKEPRHSQKDEIKPLAKKEKERERDRSKSKSNNGSQQISQQTQNIPSLLGQSIQQPVSMPQKQYDKNTKGLKLPPRFQKQRLAKQQQQQTFADPNDVNKMNSSGNNNMKDSSGGPAPPPSVNAWDKPFISQLRSNSPSAVPADVQLMSGLTSQNDQVHENNEQVNSGSSSQRNSPSGEKAGKNTKDLVEKNVSDVSSPPVQTLIFENTNYSKTTKTTPTDLAMKSKFSNHVQKQQRVDKRVEMEEEGNPMHQHSQQSLSVAFSNKPNDLMKNKNQEPIQMPLSFNKNEDNADMKLDFTFDSDLSQLTEDKSKTLGMTRSMHMSSGQSTISPSTAELNLKIASVKKVWENATPMPTVVEHEDGGNVVSTANSFPQAFENSDVDDSYSPHQQYNQNNMKNEITTSTNVCKLVPPQVKPQQQSAGSNGTQPGSTVPGPSPIGAGQSPMGHPPASLQGPLSPPPFNSTGQPSHINYQEFPQYPGSQAAQYGSMSAIPSPPAMLFNTGSGQLPAQAGGLYGAFQLDQSRSPFTQYPPYGPSLQSSFNQQNVYLPQPPPPPPHAPSAPTPDMYPNNLSQYRITAATAPPFGQNQQLSNNPNTVLISSSSNSLMSASVKPSSQPIGAIGTKAAPHFQAPSAPQPNQLPYIPYDPNQVLSVSGSYMGNSQLVQRPGPNVQASANSYYSATSADVFPGSQTGFYQPGGATQQTGTHYGLQGFGQHSQSLATGSATPVGLQNFSPGFLSNSGLQIAAAAAAQQFRNPTGGLPAPANATSTFLNKHQPQEQPRQLKSPSGNQQDVLASVFNATPQIPSPKSRNCKQQTSSQQPQPSPTQHHKYQQYQGVSQSALVLQQNVRGMGMPPRAGIQPSQQRYPPPIQRPVVPFAQGPTLNNSTQQPNSMPSQQQAQINRHRPNLHQQQQQRNMKMQQQQYYSSQGNVKIDSNDKTDSHNDKINDGNSGNQSGGNKSNVNQQDSDTKEEVSQQNE
ncbi:protein PRRC2C-like isoform X6 [Vespa mandarinia]|uniref:protein PRRC2C-like isoform X6 n=1 Tax=Vespa mandarinia TaxID=7446 RepID=UPI0016190F63|nr:protein PRRC2C-like isoform X6 [Vespa mandarinia]